MARKSRKGRMPAGLRRYWATHRRGKNPHHKKRRRARAANPAHRVKRRRVHRNPMHRAKHRRRNRVHHHVSRRRHRHSNPFGMGGMKGIIKSTLMPAAIGATGAVALDVAYAYASPYLPTSMQTGFVATLVKLAGALGVGFAASKVLGRERGKVVTLGGMTVVAYGAIKPLIAGFAPTIKGLSGYADFVDYQNPGVGAYLKNPALGFYSPAATIQPSGVGAYVPNHMGDLNGDYNWQSDGM